MTTPGDIRGDVGRVTNHAPEAKDEPRGASRGNLKTGNRSADRHEPSFESGTTQNSNFLSLKLPREIYVFSLPIHSGQA